LRSFARATSPARSATWCWRCAWAHRARLHFHAALILEAIGDTTGARAELETALAINPWFTFYDRAAIDALAARLTP